MKIILIILTIFITSCKLNKIVNHHGVHDLKNKSQKLSINQTNINEIRKLLGPSSTKSYFDNDILIYLERKTSNSKLSKLGKKKLLANNVLLLKVNDRGVLIYKEFLDKEDLKKYKFSERESNSTLDQQSFIYKALSGIRTKIDDPLGKKRGSLGK